MSPSTDDFAEQHRIKVRLEGQRDADMVTLTPAQLRLLTRLAHRDGPWDHIITSDPEGLACWFCWTDTGPHWQILWPHVYADWTGVLLRKSICEGCALRVAILVHRK